jgi:hypothetical protein
MEYATVARVAVGLFELTHPGHYLLLLPLLEVYELVSRGLEIDKRLRRQLVLNDELLKALLLVRRSGGKMPCTVVEEWLDNMFRNGGVARQFIRRWLSRDITLIAPPAGQFGFRFSSAGSPPDTPGAAR